MKFLIFNYLFLVNFLNLNFIHFNYNILIKLHKWFLNSFFLQNLAYNLIIFIKNNFILTKYFFFIYLNRFK